MDFTAHIQLQHIQILLVFNTQTTEHLEFQASPAIPFSGFAMTEIQPCQTLGSIQLGLDF